MLLLEQQQCTSGASHSAGTVPLSAGLLVADAPATLPAVRLSRWRSGGCGDGGRELDTAPFAKLTSKAGRKQAQGWSGLLSAHVPAGH